VVTIKYDQVPVPMTILTGYLGAGKTTLLNRILKGNRGLSAAVIVNDFGSVNIDAKLISGVESNIINLANGCVCCQIRNDLVNTVEELLASPDGTEYILLEASSVAEPDKIIKVLTKPRFRGRIRLDSIISVIDAEQVFAHPEYTDLFQLKLSQIAFSDLVILNKVDLVNKREIEEVKTWINMHTDHVRIVEASYCDVPLEILMSVGRFDPARQVLRGNGRYHSKIEQRRKHNQSFSTWMYESDRPFSLKALEDMIQHKLPETVYRCNGVIYAADAPKRLAVLQVAGRRSDVALIDEWKGRKPRTRIVAIGAPGKINARQLQKNFDACLSDA
jgi:G3E family GTPase